jgi:alpha,alpha-trehalose-phosphate synthase [UDP-forming]
MARKSRKLVVVSNRGPYRHETSRGRERWVRAAGGLVTALDPVLQKRGGVWVSAKPAKDFDSVTVPTPHLDYDLAHVSLKRPDQRGFYEGVSNAVLWPLLHGFEPTIQVGEAPWSSYVSANQAFADTASSTSSSGDVFWIQDYHLMLVPGLLRAKRSRARIGWFCHIPWPPPDTFGILPWREEILEGLLGADVLGFHLPEYAEHFRECVNRFTACPVSSDGTIQYRSRKVRTIAAPIGIPVDELQALALDPDVAREVERIKETMGNRKLLLGVDRLDYTKGIPDRLAAFERLLKKDRNARTKYALIQVMVPSRTDVKAYADLKEEIDRMVGDINGRFAETGRVPVHYLYRNLSQRALFAHYRAADVALVTPLRDGMNLVAHEYAAARMDEDGVLVLSEFAGAAKHLKGAVLVNPYDVESTASTIQRALSMKPAEKKKRMRALRSAVMSLDVHRWADEYVSALEGP